jgi:hypothetical protein
LINEGLNRFTFHQKCYVFHQNSKVCTCKILVESCKTACQQHENTWGLLNLALEQLAAICCASAAASWGNCPMTLEIPKNSSGEARKPMGKGNK